MTFNEALKLIKDNRNLIGRIVKGAPMDEFVVVPTNPESKAKFEKIYIQTLDAQKAIAPFLSEDVIVRIVCDKKEIRDDNIILYLSLDDAIELIQEGS